MNTSPRRVKKRLRKKLRIGEFAEYGFYLYATVINDEDGLLRDIVDKVESLDMLCGGGVSGETLRLFVVGGSRRSPTQEQRSKFHGWIAFDVRVADVNVGPMEDAWH